MEKVLIAGPYNDDVREIMRKNLSKDFTVEFVLTQEDLDAGSDTDYVILRTLKLSGDTINKMPNLKFIQRWGAGFDIIDIETAGRKGIPVANIAGENAAAVAELALLLMLAVYRNVLIINQAMHEGKWIKNTIDKSCFMISEKKVGIIGLGNIGSLVGKFVAALDANVQYYDLVRRSPEEEQKSGFTYVSLDELLRTSDIITLHVPISETTRHMIDERAFSLMKPGAVLINAARGGVVDEAALCKALDEKRLLGAGLDCFENEPLPADSPLLNYPNIVLSCHVGGNTADLAYKLAKRCPQNIRDHINGCLQEKYIVNKSFLKPN